MQLRALQSLLAYLVIPGQERTLTAFAATVATPPELLRWLGAVCMVVKLGFQSGLHCTRTCTRPCPALPRPALHCTALHNWHAWATRQAPSECCVAPVAAAAVVAA